MKGNNQNIFLKMFSSLKILILFLIMATIFAVIPYYSFALKVIFGITSLFLIPGFYFVELFLDQYEYSKKILYGLIFGFVLQLFNLLFLYVFSPFVYNQINIIASGDIELVYDQIIFSQFDLNFTILLMTLIFVTILSIIKTLYWKKPLNQNREKNFNFSLILKKIKLNNIYLILIILIICFLIRLYYQSFISFPATDGALYLDQARSLAATGTFTSKVIGVEGPTFLWNQLGLSVHLFSSFSITVFFLMGGVHFFVAQMMTIFIGVLLVFIVYELSEKLYNKNAAIIASILATLHPITIHYSTVIYGPEILGTFFTLCAYYFFIISLKGSERKYAIIAGTFAFLSLFTTFYTFLVFLAAIVISLLVLNFNQPKFLIKFISICVFTITLFMLINATALQSLSLIPNHYWIMIICLIGLSIFIVTRQIMDQKLCSVCYLYVTIGIFSFFAAIRAFYIFNVVPSAVLHVAQVPSVGNDTVSIILEMLGNFTNNFFNKFLIFFNNYAAEAISYPLVLIGLLSFMWPKKIRENIIPFSYVFFFMIIVIILGNQDSSNWYLYSKLMLFVTPFFILLASFSMVNLLKNVAHKVININLLNRKYSISLHNLYLLLLILFISMPFLPAYSSNISKMNNVADKSFGIGYYNNMKPVIEWLQNNTTHDSIVMSTKPYDLAWFANRSTVLLQNVNATKPEDYFNMDIVDLIYQIHKFKVNYLIVEYYNTFNIPVLTDILDNPYDFDVAFQTNDELGREITIFNVTAISQSSEPMEVITKYIFEADRFEIVEKDLNNYPTITDDSGASGSTAVIFQTQNPISVGSQKISLDINGSGEFMIGIKIKSAWSGSPGDWDTGLSLLINNDTIGELVLTFPNMSDYTIHKIGPIRVNGSITMSLVHTHHLGTYHAWTYIDQVIFYPTSSKWTLRSVK